ncbi:uncharacterized protein LOC123546907 [Mercenaria mercenaria]|uniref:uncharacterized protein LOC123546907 n=1 Tax=Mercenaria mercenaria TaxID=6596 RepID=UPI00234F8761|nr:uncharacterized protein LOC123546907 [Mercenaria mercenaria]
MDFSGFTLQRTFVPVTLYRPINKSARALLVKAINDLKDDITTFKMTKNTLIIHDTIGTDLSCQIINELKQYMVGKIKIDTKDAKEIEQQQQGVNTTKNNQIDVGILAVFCDAETFRKKEHEIWKKFASGFYSIAFCLYKEDSDETDKGMPGSCVIELQPSKDKKVITYLICESLLKILHKCKWQKQTSAKPTESTNEQNNSEQPATDRLEPADQHGL